LQRISQALQNQVGIAPGRRAPECGGAELVLIQVGQFQRARGLADAGHAVQEDRGGAAPRPYPGLPDDPWLVVIPERVGAPAHVVMQVPECGHPV